MFLDRQDAGRQLAETLTHYRELDPVVLALPRGGVPVALEIATALRAPLDVLVVRKLGSPGQPELGFGAVGEDDVTVLNRRLIADEGLSDNDVDRIEREERKEVARRVKVYRGDRGRVPLRNRTVILVDDGLATGFTVRAAIDILRQSGVATIILAIPVAPPQAIHALRPLVDIITCAETPHFFRSVGENYRDFHQLSDDEVNAMLTARMSPAPN